MTSSPISSILKSEYKNHTATAQAPLLSPFFHHVAIPVEILKSVTPRRETLFSANLSRLLSSLEFFLLVFADFVEFYGRRNRLGIRTLWEGPRNRVSGCISDVQMRAVPFFGTDASFLPFRRRLSAIPLQKAGLSAASTSITCGLVSHHA